MSIFKKMAKAAFKTALEDEDVREIVDGLVSSKKAVSQIRETLNKIDNIVRPLEVIELPGKPKKHD